MSMVKPRLRTKNQKAKPSSRLVPMQLLQLLSEHIPGFRDEKFAFEIAWMLWCCMDPSREHREYAGAIWMHTDEIRQLFGEVEQFINANRSPAHRYFQILRHLNGTASPKHSFTLGYWPQPWMQKVLDWSIQGGQQLDFIDSRGDARRVYSRAIRSTDVRGHMVRRWAGVSLPPLIPVNAENLQLLLRMWEYLIQCRQQPKILAELLKRYGLKEAALDRAQRQTQVFIAEAQGGKRTAVLHVRYVLHESGRLYAEGLNLQSCKREIRQAALAGCWDIDMSTCHFAILAQMAKRFNVSCPSIEGYVARKKEFRAEIARDIGVSLGESKKIINAVGYGAPRSTSPYTEIARQIGQEKAAVFFKHPLCRGIKEDVDTATAIILAKHPTKGKNLINLANRAIAKESEKGESVKDGTLMAHLLQGVEAAALEAAVRACDKRVLLLQHDGFTAVDAVDPAMLRAAVQKDTGYDLTFEVEQIQMPFEGLEVDGQRFNIKLKEAKNPNTHVGLQPFWPCFSGTVAFCADDVPPVFPLSLPPPPF